MKKILLLLCGLAALCSHLAAQEHPKNIVGLRAGYAASWATTYGVKSSIKPGYSVGISDEVLLSQRLPFYFETGLHFIAKGYRINGYDDSSTSFNYLKLPVGISYHIRAGKDVSVEPAVGLYYAVGLGGKREISGGTTKVFSDGSTSRSDLGYAIGLGATVSRFHFGISYDAGLLNVDKADLVYGDGSPLIGYKKLKNNSLIISVGVNF